MKPSCNFETVEKLLQVIQTGGLPRPRLRRQPVPQAARALLQAPLGHKHIPLPRARAEILKDEDVTLPNIHDLFISGF